MNKDFELLKEIVSSKELPALDVETVGSSGVFKKVVDESEFNNMMRFENNEVKVEDVYPDMRVTDSDDK